MCFQNIEINFDFECFSVDNHITDTQDDENITVEKFLEMQFQIILDVSNYAVAIMTFYECLVANVYSQLGIQTAFNWADKQTTIRI